MSFNIREFQKAEPRTILLLLLLLCPLAVKAQVTVGSKNFPESYILAEIISKVIETQGGLPVNRKPGMGGTGLVYQALLNGDVDLYPEYTGTISQVILKDPSLEGVDDIRMALKKNKLVISDPLGFNNTYAFGVRRETAERLSLKKISDLKKHPTLKAAFSYEFMKRADGYPALAKRYGLRLKNVNRMEHSLAYEAISKKKVDLIDVYTTDAKLEKLDLALLEDDQKFFPTYFGVILARQDFVDQHPEVWGELLSLEGTMNDQLMRHLNSLADIDKKSFSEVAEIFLGSSQWLRLSNKKPLPIKKKGTFLEEYVDQTDTFWAQMWKLTKEHLFLVFVSLGAAILVGVPLGIISLYSRSLGQMTLVVTGILQTIPSLALLCFLIPFFGIGTVPALIALFLYGLLPIVRNTYSGLMALDPRMIETGRALGLSRFQILRYIQLPLASIHILSGIKTSAVINVGTATLAALIGAGGYGTLIVTGLALNDLVLILKGALPAALLAMLIHALFEAVDTLLIPKGLQH